jgi:hypothetical protein
MSSVCATSRCSQPEAPEQKPRAVQPRPPEAQEAQRRDQVQVSDEARQRLAAEQVAAQQQIVQS